jgi:hypothetical protein
MKHISHGCVYPTELKAEANNNAQNQQSNKEFEASQSPHTTRRRIKDKYNQNIQNGYSAASHEWNMKEDVQSNRCTNHLDMSANVILHACA